MKKILVISSIVLSGFAFAQNSDNPFIYDTSEDLQEEEVVPGNPGDPKPAPIDQYIPVLILTAVLLAYRYGKKKKIV